MGPRLTGRNASSFPVPIQFPGVPGTPYNGASLSDQASFLRAASRASVGFTLFGPRFHILKSSLGLSGLVSNGAWKMYSCPVKPTDEILGGGFIFRILKEAPLGTPYLIPSPFARRAFRPGERSGTSLFCSPFPSPRPSSANHSHLTPLPRRKKARHSTS